MNRFKYIDQNALLLDAEQKGFDLPWSENIELLYTPVHFGSYVLGNRFVIHPMEGFDASAKGAPDDLTYRRYRRYAKGGSGLIWIEATSVMEEGLSNPRQLLLKKNNLSGFSRLADIIKEDGRVSGSIGNTTRSIIQLTHSGKYSKPNAKGVGAQNDDSLKRVRDCHVDAAILAEKAGFDAVDIKISHGYLLHELLYSVTNSDSIYSGELLENRIRLVTEIISAIAETCRLEISSRLNVYDGIEGGFGTQSDAADKPDWSEVQELLHQPGFQKVGLWSVTAGIPYINPWVTRPFDRPAIGGLPSPEHPLVGVDRMINLTASVKKISKKIVVGAGLSWLRQFVPFVAAGIVADKKADLIGLGRMAFAYPDLPKDLHSQGSIDKSKVCVTCSGCTNRMRKGIHTGCIIRDREVYAENKFTD